MSNVAHNVEAHAQQQKEMMIKVGVSEEKAEARRLEILATTVTPGSEGDPQYKSAS